jgi:hypothetical protein
MNFIEIIDNTIIESIFEHVSHDQSPKDFVNQCKMFLRNEHEEIAKFFTISEIEDMIMTRLMIYLDEEYDLNLFRLKHFPAHKIQEYDI